MLAVAWLVLAVALVLIELHTGTFYCLLLAAASTVTIIAALAGLPLLVQCFTFVVAITLMYIFLLPLLRKLIPSTSKTPFRPITDEWIGQEAYVIQTIRPDDAGLVHLNGEVWTAIANETIEEGSKVKVVEVRVTKLFVTKG
ncbi:NfeD family protein [Paenibacillus rhizovicinus]|uniref:NfeD family protein n=1 Tax=Paenibacillus rhizovicinus TaxID=2704463 RepID=A0A6C0P344_9BACL|nr:NfeD family protein [Paenibacillus rhizovicinus]QHW32918.1 NfeD family protein [Paenibacillus rhizovicinus]